MAESAVLASEAPALAGDEVPPLRQRSARLEAFKRAIESAQRRRAQDFQERRTLLQNLGGCLRDSSLSEEEKRCVQLSFNMQQNKYMRESRRQVTISDFQVLKVIGSGFFGIVKLCRKKDTGEVFALKQMNKQEMLYKNHVDRVRAERDALSRAEDDWVIRLHYTFQDNAFLYMVMDYMPGGDLMTHLMRKGTFSELEARFYTAEIVEAVDYIHTRLHCIHRDIKPDNIVLDGRGHIRLLDFGLCKHVHSPQPAASDPRLCRSTGVGLCHPSRSLLQSVVGTPDYMGPEVFQNSPYGEECDWWSVGIITFEMLFGGPPFSDDDHDPAMTSTRIVRWRQYFSMPLDRRVGRNARDLIAGLICDPKDRLDAQGIRTHPFFSGLDFARLRDMAAPIRPVVRGLLDTSNFDNFDSMERQYPVMQSRHLVVEDPSLFAFHDYDYRRDLREKKPSVSVALNSLDSFATEPERKLSGITCNVLLHVLQRLSLIRKICSLEA